MTNNLKKCTETDLFYEKGRSLSKQGRSFSKLEQWPRAIKAFKSAKLAFEKAKRGEGVTNCITIQHAIDDSSLHGARAMYFEALKCASEPVDKDLSHLVAEYLLAEAKKWLEEITEGSPSRNNLYRNVRDDIGTAFGRFSVWGAADTALANYYASRQSTTAIDATESQKTQHIPGGSAEDDAPEAIPLKINPEFDLAAILARIAEDRERRQPPRLLHETARTSAKR